LIDANGKMSEVSKKYWRRGFWCLMVTQCQNAFSDNLLKQFIIYLILAKNLSEEEFKPLVSDAGFYFALPFLFFSATGGWLADRFSKKKVMNGVKLMELGIMAFACFALNSGEIIWQFMSIALMGLHSALFAASKYSSLPEIVPIEQLSWGNGILEMLTFLGAILGTLAAPILADSYGDRPVMAGYFLLLIAGCGFLASLGIPSLRSVNPEKRYPYFFLMDLFREYSSMAKDRDLWRANIGNGVFFFLAFLLQINLLLYAETIFKVDPHENSTLQVALALGMAAGSWLAGKISHHRVEYGLIPLGALIMAGSALVLGWPSVAYSIFTLALVLIGVGGGLFIVPIATVLQIKPSEDRKGSVQGAAAWFSWVMICVAAVVQSVLANQLNLNSSQIFWVAALVCVLIGIYVNQTRPGALSDLIFKSKANLD
jgi:acyl-[acyl-carrier-protein]-phospholipid O-acyltransferase/long-chain-fatty-acid--[acyl-carrier-protein] ligase